MSKEIEPLEALKNVRQAVDELEKGELLGKAVLAPLRVALDVAQKKTENLTSIQLNVEAIREEIIAPVTNRFRAGEALAKASAVMGLVGIALSVVLYILSSQESNSTLRIVARQFLQLPPIPLSDIADLSIVDLEKNLSFGTKGGLRVEYSETRILTVESDTETIIAIAAPTCPGSWTARHGLGASTCSVSLNIFKVRVDNSTTICVAGLSAINLDGDPCVAEVSK